MSRERTMWLVRVELVYAGRIITMEVRASESSEAMAIAGAVLMVRDAFSEKYRVNDVTIMGTPYA